MDTAPGRARTSPLSFVPRPPGGTMGKARRRTPRRGPVAKSWRSDYIRTTQEPWQPDERRGIPMCSVRHSALARLVSLAAFVALALACGGARRGGLPAPSPGLEARDEDYATARSTFRTKLLRTGPAPQPAPPL